MVVVIWCYNIPKHTNSSFNGQGPQRTPKNTVCCAEGRVLLVHAEHVYSYNGASYISMQFEL